MVGKVRLPDDRAKLSPKLRLERAYAVKAPVHALVNPVTGVAAGETLVAASQALSSSLLRQCQSEPADRAVGQRHIEPATLVTALGGDQRSKERDLRLQLTATDVP